MCVWLAAQYVCKANFIWTDRYEDGSCGFGSARTSQNLLLSFGDLVPKGVLLCWFSSWSLGAGGQGAGRCMPIE